MKTIKIITINLLFLCGLSVFIEPVLGQSKKAIIAYYSGSLERLDSFDVSLVTHIIYCFGHLQGNRLHLRSLRDTAMIQKMVGLKSKNPPLKVLLSLGGWGGCKTCSEVFATEKGRNEFASSVKKVIDYFGADGIDLDWEYPAIQGYPGHAYMPEDKDNFTALVYRLRKVLGKNKIVSFAAGGFKKFTDEAVDWKKVMKKADFVNLMTYDLVHGYSTTTGHHTALYSDSAQPESTDRTVRYLIEQGIDPAKLIIGAAFYGRIWKDVPNANNGLYQPGVFRSGAGFKDFPQILSQDSGFVYYWDDVVKAPYAYNAGQKLFATFDDRRSMQLKSLYVLEKNLGGIMFWQLGDDVFSGGLLHMIHTTLNTGGLKQD